MRHEIARVRDALPDDAAALARLYGWHVLHGTGTFEIDPPSEADMAARLQAVHGNGWPWLVAERPDGSVAGFAYANQFRPRPAYRHYVENSVYVDESARGQGVGRQLMRDLIARCEAAGARQMVAVIGDAANAGSIGLHAALGFAHTGVLKAAGWKFGAWRDVVLMQRALGDGDRTPAP